MATFSGRLSVYGLFSNILMPSLAPNGPAISFSGVPGRTYTVQRALKVTGPWSIVATVAIDDRGVGTYEDQNAPATNAFYRITYP
jgi:hypothetical protein